MSAMIEISGLTKRYGDQTVLDGAPELKDQLEPVSPNND
jgi:hypothetical protein